jgi:hypothetical protein
MKRFDDKDRPAPGGSRTGPRARAAQDRKFGGPPSRPPRASPSRTDRADPYKRADRPPRPDGARSAPYGDRLRAPSGGAITLDPDVARVFRDSEAVNEALRLVIRLARSVAPGPRPAFNRSAPSAGPRSGGFSPGRPRAPSERFSRDGPPRERRTSPGAARREPKFEESE